jgi:hypothetical protein
MDEIETLRRELEELKIKNSILEEKLKTKYKKTINSHRKYYEANIDVVKERAKKYMEKIKVTHPEKLKEWRHTAYLKQKEKRLAAQKEKELINNN